MEKKGREGGEDQSLKTAGGGAVGGAKGGREPGRAGPVRGGGGAATSPTAIAPNFEAHPSPALGLRSTCAAARGQPRLPPLLPLPIGQTYILGGHPARPLAGAACPSRRPGASVRWVRWRRTAGRVCAGSAISPRSLRPAIPLLRAPRLRAERSGRRSRTPRRGAPPRPLPRLGPGSAAPPGTRTREERGEGLLCPPTRLPRGGRLRRSLNEIPYKAQLPAGS